MSAAPRDDGARARRRRRRATPQPPRFESDLSSPPSQRPPRRHPPNHSSKSQRNSARDASDHHDSGDQERSEQLFRGKREEPETGDHLGRQVPSNNASAVATESSESGLHIDQLQREKEEREAKDAEIREKRLAEQLERRGAERQANLCFTETEQGDMPKKERPTDSELRQLDSSLKKCNGFLRKLRSSGVTEETVEALQNEASALNLSRYISEVISAISESKLRSGDVEHLVLLCGALHRRYEDFSSQLVAALGGWIGGAPPGQPPRDLSTRKAAMRLIVEMFVLGMYVDISHVTSVLKHLMKGSKDSKDDHLNNLSVLSAFVRAGSKTLLPRPLASSHAGTKSEGPASDRGPSWEDSVLPDGAKTTIHSALQSYFDSDVIRIYNDANDDLHNARVALTRSTQARGSADESQTQSFEAAKQVYDRVLASANVLAEGLGKLPFRSSPTTSPMVEAPPDPGAPSDASHVSLSNPFATAFKSRNTTHEADLLLYGDHPFEGDSQRMFYTELLILDGSSSTTLTRSHSKTSERPQQGEKSNTEGKGSDRDLSEAASSANSTRTPGGSMASKQPDHNRTTTENRKRGSEKPLSVDKILGKLSSVESKEEADSFTREIVVAMDGSRNGTKRLSKALYSVSAQKLNVLPAYARVSASLRPVYPDIASSISTSLEEDFRFLASKSDTDEKTLAACIKTAQYVGEYVKFGLFEVSTMFDLLSMSMKDFSGHRVDVACHLLEACGRFVYLSPSSHVRMGSILETLWRLKSVKNLEARHNALVETAYFAVRLAPGSTTHKKKMRPPLHEYIRHLIYYRLQASNIRWTQNQLLKLPWDEELERYVIKKFVKVSRARFSTIPYVGTLIASLQKHKPSLVVGIVDSLVESIRSGMEKNDGRDSQRRIAEIHLLGEMHKCGVVDERVAYNVLYQLITLGHETSDSGLSKQRRSVGSPSFGLSVDRAQDDVSSRRPLNGAYVNAPDPPGDFFRIRLACVLIESCGRVLAASNRRKLQVYWVFLERYLFCKTYQAGQRDRLPLHINHIIGDVFENVVQKGRRPGKDGRASLQRDSGDHSSERRKETNQDGSWPGQGQFCRSTSLEEALSAVTMVERSASDSALISVPLRQVLPYSNHVVPSSNHQTQNHGRTDMSVLPSPGRGSGIRGNFVDGFVTTSRTVGNTDERGRFGRESGYDERDAGNLNGDVGMGGEFEEDADGTVSGDDVYYDDVEEDIENEHMNEDDEDTFDDTLDGEDSEETVTGHEEDCEDEDEGDDDDEDDEDDDDDDDVVLGGEHSRPRTEEEDAFAKELAAFTAAAVQSARASSSRVTKFDRMAIPMSLMTQKLEEERAAAAAQAANAINRASSDEEMTESSRRKKRSRVKSVEFKMLVRKGGKSQLQGLQVPTSSSLAVAARESETADAARHEETKRLVLGSSTILNDDSDDLDEEVPLRAQQHARDKEESIRQQRSADEMELLSTLYRTKPRR